MPKPKLQSVITNISLPSQYLRRMKDLADQLGISVSDLLRRGFDMYEKEHNAEKFGRYKGTEVAKSKISKQQQKEDRENKIAWLRSASGPEILQFLLECGYIEMDQIVFEQGAKLVRVVVEANESGIMALRQHFHDKDSGELVYTSDLQPLEEVIRGLIKEKKI